MLTCPFVHLILQSKGQKAPKSGSFKNEAIPEVKPLLPTERTAFRFPPVAVDAVSLKTPPILAQKPLSGILDLCSVCRRPR
jgi:hypothetical protein